MLGKEEHVRQNADLYKDTKFADVDITRWYAPYAGYGHKTVNRRHTITFRASGENYRKGIP